MVRRHVLLFLSVQRMNVVWCGEMNCFFYCGVLRWDKRLFFVGFMYEHGVVCCGVVWWDELLLLLV